MGDFFSYVSVFLNSSSVYIQKRLEVHRKMKLLAVLSIVSAIFSVVFSYVGGRYWGIYGVSIGLMLAQGLYFLLVAYSIHKKMSVYRALVVPLFVAVLTVIAGAAYYYALGALIHIDDWRVKSALWLIGFSVLSLLALWKGVKWGEFTKAII